MRCKHSFFTIVIAIFWIFAVFALAQRPMEFPQRLGRSGRPPRPMISDDPVTSDGTGLSRKMLKASYEQMQKDAARLSELADDLKQDVSTSADGDTLSVTTIKKAEEIEKLAKKIQSRMKNL